MATPKWSVIAADPDYQKLSPDDQQKVKQRYWDNVVSKDTAFSAAKPEEQSVIQQRFFGKPQQIQFAEGDWQSKSKSIPWSASPDDLQMTPSAEYAEDYQNPITQAERREYHRQLALRGGSLGADVLGATSRVARNITRALVSPTYLGKYLPGFEVVESSTRDFRKQLAEPSDMEKAAFQISAELRAKADEYLKEELARKSANFGSRMAQAMPGIAMAGTMGNVVPGGSLAGNTVKARVLSNITNATKLTAGGMLTDDGDLKQRLLNAPGRFAGALVPASFLPGKVLPKVGDFGYGMMVDYGSNKLTGAEPTGEDMAVQGAMNFLTTLDTNNIRQGLPPKPPEFNPQAMMQRSIQTLPRHVESGRMSIPQPQSAMGAVHKVVAPEVMPSKMGGQSVQERMEPIREKLKSIQTSTEPKAGSNVPKLRKGATASTEPPKPTAPAKVYPEGASEKTPFHFDNEARADIYVQKVQEKYPQYVGRVNKIGDKQWEVTFTQKPQGVEEPPVSAIDARTVEPELSVRKLRPEQAAKQDAIRAELNAELEGKVVPAEQPKVVEPPKAEAPSPQAEAKGDRITNVAETTEVISGKTWYHGTPGSLASNQIDLLMGEPRGLMGVGFYLTDDPAVARGYANKKRGTDGQVYPVQIKARSVLDLESPAPAEVRKAFEKALYENMEFRPNKNATTEQLFGALRDAAEDHSADHAWPASEYTELFQNVADNIKALGYDAMQHEGGKRTGGVRHRVVVLLNPEVATVGKTQAESKVKEPWEMTREEWREFAKKAAQGRSGPERDIDGNLTDKGRYWAAVGKMTPDEISAAAKANSSAEIEDIERKSAIRQAYAEGKPIPPEVLAELGLDKPVAKAEAEATPTEIFIRAPKKSEYGNPSRSLSSIPDKAGYEKVHKPYGPDGDKSGRGYYYVQSKAEAPIASKNVNVTKSPVVETKAQETAAPDIKEAKLAHVNRESGSGDQTPPLPKAEQPKAADAKIGDTVVTKSGGRFTVTSAVNRGKGGVVLYGRPEGETGGRPVALRKETIGTVESQQTSKAQPKAKAVGKAKPPTPLEGVMEAVANDTISDVTNGVKLLNAAIDFGKVGKEVATEATKRAQVLMQNFANYQFPAITQSNRAAGEVMSEYAASNIYAKWAAKPITTKLNEMKVDLNKLGAALTEDNLRDPSVGEAGAEKRTIIGAEGSPFKTEAEYQAYLKDADTQKALDILASDWLPESDAMYKAAMDITPDTELPSRGQQTGIRINLKAMSPDDAFTDGVVRLPGQSTAELRKFARKSPFGRKAKGTAAAYDINLERILENSYARQLEIANFKRAAKALVASGDAVIGTEMPQNIKGEAVVALPYNRRGKTLIVREGEPTVFGKGGAENLYIRKSLADEFQNAMPSSPYTIPGVSKVLQGTNILALAGPLDNIIHFTNLAGALTTSPGTGGTAVREAIRTAGMGPGLLLNTMERWTTKAFTLGSAKNQAQLADLARIGALRNFENVGRTLNPLKLQNKLMQRMDHAARLVMDDAWSFLVRSGLKEDTTTGRRNFVNSLGNYNKRAQTKFTRFMRETGIAPFATAGKTFNAQAWRTMTGTSPGKAASGKARAALGAMAAARWAGALGTVALINMLTTDEPWGREGTPVGHIDTGKNHENGKPVTIPVLMLLGYDRALGVTGVKSAVQSTRNNQTPQEAMGAAGTSILTRSVSPYMGPAARLGAGLAFGSAPTSPQIRRARVAVPGQPQLLENAKYTLSDLAQVSDFFGGSKSPSILMQTGIPERRAEQMPEMIRYAQTAAYVDDSIKHARNLPEKERWKAVQKDIEKLQPTEQAIAWNIMRRKGRSLSN